jgi:hypothetical protein
LYHPIFVGRDHQNQPLIRLGEGYLVLYHPLTGWPQGGFPPLAPLLHIRITILEIARILIAPSTLGNPFSLLLALPSMTCLLTFSYSRIGYKKPSAKQTPLPQG